MLNDCNETISDYGTVYLDADGIFRCAPKPFDLEVRFEPFEEKLNAPSVLVKQRDGQCVRLKIVCEEDIFFARFRVTIDDFSYLFWINPRAFINGEVSDGIRQNVLGKSPFPRFALTTKKASIRWIL